MQDEAPSAIKVGLEGTPILQARFLREAGILRQVGTPHVPQFYATGRLEDGRPWIAMERLFGRTLGVEIKARLGAPDQEWVMRRADALLLALSAVHALGFVHRDLKPDNIFLPEGRGAPDDVALLDFGLSKGATRVSADLTLTGAAVGTLNYMAPEQLGGDRTIDVRTDIYAVGVILFELLTSRTPFLGDASSVEHGHLALRPPRPSQFAPVPSALEEIVLTCLAKDPARRPADVTSLRRALQKVRQEATPPDAPSHASAHSAGAKILGEGRVPAVLMLAETRAAMPVVVAAISSRKGFIARQRGGRYVAVFSSRDVGHPALVALTAAQEIVDRLGGRAALHLSNVVIRRRDRGASIASGAAVEHPEEWAPREPWSGIVLGAEVERLLRETTPSSARRIFPAIDADSADVEVNAPLLGRASVLAALDQSAAVALEGGCPSLFTILGDAGLGKSRVAIEAAEIARRRHPGAQIVVLKPGAPQSGEAPPETAELLRVALSAPAAAPADVEAFCRERLGDAVGAGTWSAVAAALDWGGIAVGMPLQRGVLWAITEGLRRRAREEALVVILDDAHEADDVVVDALEAASLDGEGIPLWVVTAASTRFEKLRPGWGMRTQHFAQVTLTPLDASTAAALAAALLRPAEYPPVAVLTTLATWSGGNPGCLSEIGRALKRAGAILKRPNAESYYLATTELEKLPASPAWQWLAARSLDTMPPGLAAFVRLCAALGASFGRAELEWTQDALDREGGAGTPIDADFGLSALVERGILRRLVGDRHTFATRMIRDSIVAMLDPVHLRAIHRHALAYFRSQIEEGSASPDDLEPLASHASACGAKEDATDAYLRLGERALSRHRHVEADRHFTAAIDLAADTRQRASALLGRGRCRYRLHRPQDAVKDLTAARALTEELLDDALLAEILLEKATARDWANDFEASAQQMEEASALIARLDDPRLATRLLVARGRTCIRRGQMDEAAAWLLRAAADASIALDYDTHIVARLLLPVALVCLGQLGEAEARFEEAITLATEAEDWSHLCAIYINRIYLWAAKKDLRRAVEEMSRTITLAREIGNPFQERLATINVAEILHWEGKHGEALALARRAKILDERFLDEPALESSLVMARILLSTDAHEKAAQIVNWIAATCRPAELSPTKRAFFGMLQRALHELDVALSDKPIATWEDILGGVRGKLLEMEMLELLYWRARMAVRGGRLDEAREALGEARTLLAEFPMWLSSFDAVRDAAEEGASRQKAHSG